MNNIQIYLTRLQEFGPEMLESLGETAIMITLAIMAALLLGLPLGTLLFLTNKGRPLENKRIYRIGNLFVNIVRSFPFLLLVVAMQPLIRATYGRATGDPVAASFPLMLIAIAIYGRFAEQALTDVPKDVTETAKAMGATIPQYLFKFMYGEALPALLTGFTSSIVSFISYSTILGAVGGGGIGDFAIRYGYQRYETDVMYTAIIIIIIFVQIIQGIGARIAGRVDKR
jgi:D-methionine transport system permease protein